MTIEAGKIYKVKHRHKGEFCLAVQFSDKNFTTGLVVEGKPISFSEVCAFSAGSQYTVRNSFCEFTELEISEAKKS